MSRNKEGRTGPTEGDTGTMPRGRMVTIVLVSFLLLACGLCGCVIKPEDDGGKDTLTITDDHGRVVTVPLGGERVISLAPSNTEILYALDLGDRVVAVDNNTNYPPEATEKPRVSGYKWLDMEVIVGLEPDVIFAADINKEMVPQLEEQDLKVVVLAPNDIQGIFDDIRLVGKVMDIDQRAGELASELEGRMNEITDKTLEDGVERPAVYLELDSFNGYFTYGPGTFGHELITLSGGENIAGQEQMQYPMLTDEFIIASDPQVIIYQTGPWTTTTPEGIRSRVGWENVTAVRERDIAGVDGDLVSRPGPRIVDGLEAIAGIIHPELVT